MTLGSLSAGLALGLGLALVWSWWVARVPRLEARVAPHVRGTAGDEVRRRDTTITPFPTLERLLAPVVRDGVRYVERYGSPGEELRRRLDRAGSSLTVEHYRAQQVLSGVGALLAALVAALVLAATRGSSPIALIVLVAAATGAGVYARDAWLGRVISRREQRVIAELPTVAELLALAVSAGEGAAGALERVAQSTHGAMSHELRLTLGSARSGSPLTHALSQMADRTGVLALRRFADAVATAVARGTPLADVLRAQAQDVRAAGQRALMEEGGKREIAMMVPVVFLILPVTVVFAVFPGVATIQLGL